MTLACQASSRNPMEAHRHDIDGLRAFAVVAVILYHTGVISGGFVGVDVFFVISGFLITSIIIEERADGRFSMLRFYERRIRRLLPALLTVVFAVLIGSSILFLPDDARSVGSSAAATALFVPNVHLWRGAGYFTEAAEAKPLLHLWSLGVEEQFYLIWPALLLVIGKARGPILAVAGASLALSAWGAVHAPDATFYLLPSRAWELLLGALIAGSTWGETLGSTWRNVLSWTGFFMIAAPAALYAPRLPFPGLTALLPCLGAAALIVAGPAGHLNRALAIKPVVFVGLISYSLYLWHWPAIVFARYALVDRATPIVIGAAVAVSSVAAVVSWRFIEQPARQARVRRSNVYLMAAAGTILALIAGLGLRSFPSWAVKTPPQALALARFGENFNPHRQRCHFPSSERFDASRACVFGASVRATIAVWGDSHAAEIAFELGSLMGDRSQAVVELSTASCPPFAGFETLQQPGCRERNEKTLAFLNRNESISTVVLVAYFNLYPAAAVDSIGGTVGALLSAGKTVVVIYPLPDHSSHVPRALARYATRGRSPDLFARSRADFFQSNKRAFRALDTLGDRSGLVRVYPHHLFCNERWCRAIEGGRPLYFDDNHLDLIGARKVAIEILKQLDHPQSPGGSARQPPHDQRQRH